MASFLLTIFAYIWFGYVLFMYKPGLPAIGIIFDGLLVTTMIALSIFFGWLML